MKRFFAAITGFLLLPILFSLPTWWPFLFGGTPTEFERAHMNAYVLVRYEPALVFLGLSLCWKMRARFFDSLAISTGIGLLSGSLASFFTYLTYAQPILNPFPFFYNLPMMGGVCSLVAFAIAAKLENRIFNR